ncbi:uncharacterized protein LOC111335121 isoform X2 [Stylophora pistillata]|uniref:uncharacterized protein LOC111335121 isoform X2 n=1 Tax=Stylophora pistillata TaxID=50429 RepID=UPI000C04E84E|nr:uncharacterized protein LOC111335121 isoform X2 [Stylophora pistillata]
MLTKACQIWGTVLVSITLLGYARLDQDICDSRENPCSKKCIKEEESCDQQCQKGNYSCSLDCNGKICNQGCDAERCNLECHSENCVQKCNSDVKECIMYSDASKGEQTCDAKVCVMTVSASSDDTLEQKCNGVVARCEAQCYVVGGNCKQHCDAGRCNLDCSGKECDQKCNGVVNECNMQCNAGICKQTCDAKECHITGSAIHDIPEQKCNGGTDICDAQCYVSSGRCLQHCDAKKCNLECCGKECDQKCNGGVDGCNMYCTTNECEQKCDDACSCNGTKIQPVNSLAEQKCISIFNYRTLFTPNVIASASTTTTAVIKTQPSTTQALSSSSSISSSPLLSLSSSSFSSSSSSSSLSSSSLTCTSPSLPLVTIESLGNEYVFRLYGIDISRETSLKEAMILFEDFADLCQNITKRIIGQLCKEEIKKRTEAIFQVAVAFEKFVLKYSKYHLSEARPSKKMTDQKMAVGIQLGYRQNTSDFLLKKEEWQASINISSANFAENGSVIVGCVYKDLHELLLTHQSVGNEIDNTRFVNTRIMTADMDPKPEKLQQDVILKFRSLEVVEEEKRCMFWSGYSKSPDGFTSEGCHVDSAKSNSVETVCRCNHLTYFAVLVDFDSGDKKLTKKDGTILETITYVGLSLSIIGMLLTIILYSFLTDVRQPLSQIRLSLSASLGAGQMIFLAGINATENIAACITAAALMQYFLMAAFCWMLVEGIYLYLFVVKVYKINTKMHMYHVMSWGFPVVMIAISLSISAGKEGIQSYTSNKYCWMSSANSLIWIFVTFVITIEFVNILILIRVVREMTRMQPTGDKQIQQIRLGIRACAVMIPLLGVTWLFGLLSPLHKVFAYIFNIVNSTQIKERFNRKVNTVFPSVNKGNSTKKGSQVNLSDVGDARGVELVSYH